MLKSFGSNVADGSVARASSKASRTVSMRPRPAQPCDRVAPLLVRAYGHDHNFVDRIPRVDDVREIGPLPANAPAERLLDFGGRQVDEPVRRQGVPGEWRTFHAAAVVDEPLRRPT